MRQIAREPLVHFLLLGVALFMAYELVSKPGSSDSPGKIIVTQGQIDNLVSGFAKAWQRPPTKEELAGLVQDLIREEVYCREAMALGLDKDDIVIRHRLRQKMEFISDDIAAMPEPTDADLNAYLQAHSDRFSTEERFSFSQVYLDPAKHENVAHDIDELLTRLNSTGGQAEASALGDSLLLDSTFKGVSTSEVAKQFGEKFSAKLAGVSMGQWQGPVESGYGVHLVFVAERTEGRVHTLAEVRDDVSREWANAERLKLNEKFYQDLQRRYTVSIEGLESTKNSKRLAAITAK
jgi:parvulin-like peptidyl-prolyl cis-trans isomerase-like protein